MYYIRTWIQLNIVFMMLPMLGIGSDTLVEATHQSIEYQGRIEILNSSALIRWPASNFSISIKSDRIGLLLEDSKGLSRYRIEVNGQLHSNIQPTQELDTLWIQMNNKGNHTINVFRLSEITTGTTTFNGFLIPKNTALNKMEKPKSRIDFYGDSISTGMGLVQENESSKRRVSNAYLAYPAIVARAFDAQINLIARAGIGISIGWTKFEMIDIFDKTNPYENRIWKDEKSKPDLIVVNLLQNDFSFSKKYNHSLYLKKFGSEKKSVDFYLNEYENFIRTLKSDNSGVPIICMLGNMNITSEKSIWVNKFQSLIRNFEDDDVFCFISPFKGTAGHPTKEEQEIMAYELINFINVNDFLDKPKQKQ